MVFAGTSARYCDRVFIGNEIEKTTCVVGMHSVVCDRYAEQCLWIRAGQCRRNSISFAAV